MSAQLLKEIEAEIEKARETGDTYGVEELQDRWVQVYAQIEEGTA